MIELLSRPKRILGSSPQIQSLQKIVQQAATESQDYQRKVARGEDEKSLEVLTKSMKVADLTPAETARIREKIKPVIDKYAKDVGEPMMKELSAEIAKARGGK